MKPQFDNLVMSSMLLWFDNKLLTKGEAFQNTTGRFYSVLDDSSVFIGSITNTDP